MINYITNPGYSGSEIERAVMGGCDFPQESTLERVLRQRVAKGLIRFANYLAPSNSVVVQARNIESYC